MLLSDFPIHASIFFTLTIPFYSYVCILLLFLSTDNYYIRVVAILLIRQLKCIHVYVQNSVNNLIKCGVLKLLTCRLDNEAHTSQCLSFHLYIYTVYC